MTPDPARVAEVAARLTGAQRRTVLGGTDIGCVATNPQIEQSLIGKGLATKPPGYSRRMVDWAPLGLAVRQYLLEQGEDV